MTRSNEGTPDTWAELKLIMSRIIILKNSVASEEKF